MRFVNLLNDTVGDRIGIFVSGGIDSALLLYLLMSENELLSAKKTITVFSIPKTDGTTYYAPLVVELISSMLHIDPPKLFFVGNKDWPHQTIVNRSWNDVAARNIVDSIFLADNITPNEDLPGLMPVRSKTSSNLVQQPFFNLTKDEIIQSVFDYGIEKIFEFTHTCTERPRGRCDECWQCNERAWAFSKINKVDTGKE